MHRNEKNSDHGLFLCADNDIEEGRSRGFDPQKHGRDSIFVVKKDGLYFAYRTQCPHIAQSRLAWRKDEYLNGDHSRIMCGAHGALFEIDSGLCVSGPCLGQSLFPVEVEQRGTSLYLTDSRYIRGWSAD